MAVPEGNLGSGNVGRTDRLLGVWRDGSHSTADGGGAADEGGSSPPNKEESRGENRNETPAHGQRKSVEGIRFEENSVLPFWTHPSLGVVATAKLIGFVSSRWKTDVPEHVAP